MCCPTTRLSCVRNLLACAVRDTPVRITTTAKTVGAAHTSTHTGACEADSHILVFYFSFGFVCFCKFLFVLSATEHYRVQQ